MTNNEMLDGIITLLCERILTQVQATVAASVGEYINSPAFMQRVADICTEQTAAIKAEEIDARIKAAVKDVVTGVEFDDGVENACTGSMWFADEVERCVQKCMEDEAEEHGGNLADKIESVLDDVLYDRVKQIIKNDVTVSLDI